MADLSEGGSTVIRDNDPRSEKSQSVRSSRTFTGRVLSNFEPNLKVIKTTVNNHRPKLAKNSSPQKSSKVLPRASYCGSDDRSEASKTTINFNQGLRIYEAMS